MRRDHFPGGPGTPREPRGPLGPRCPPGAGARARTVAAVTSRFWLRALAILALAVGMAGFGNAGRAAPPAGPGLLPRPPPPTPNPPPRARGKGHRLPGL